MTADLSIVIVTYNSAGELGDCLRSVFASEGAPSFEVIVFDNASADGTRSVVEQFGSAQLIASPNNVGSARGCNLAAESASGSRILLLNPDTVLRHDTLAKVCTFADANPAYQMYGGRTLHRNGSLEPSSCWGTPTMWSYVCFGTGLSAAFPGSRWFDPESLGRWQRDTVREVGVVTGCFLLITRAAWDQLAGFDERYFLYGEDKDLSMRARKLGVRPIICPDAALVHDIGRSSPDNVTRALFIYRGKATLALGHLPTRRAAVAIGLLQSGVAIRAMAAAARRSSDQRWRQLWLRRREWRVGFG